MSEGTGRIGARVAALIAWSLWILVALSFVVTFADSFALNEWRRYWYMLSHPRLRSAEDIGGIFIWNIFAPLAQVGLAALLEPSHPRIVPEHAKVATGEWRLATPRASMPLVGIGGALTLRGLLYGAVEVSHSRESRQGAMGQEAPARRGTFVARR